MSDEPNNLDVIYKYTEANVKDTLTSLNGLNTRLVAVAAVCGVLLKFATDLNFPILRILTSVSLTIGFLSCFAGLIAVPSGNLASTGKLMDEWYYESDEQCRLYILNNWRVTLERIDEKRVWKAQSLNCAYVFVTLAFLILADAVIFDVKACG